jgi:hypothetical protein
MQLSIDLKCAPVARLNGVKIYFQRLIINRVQRKLAWPIRIKHDKAIA